MNALPYTRWCHVCLCWKVDSRLRFRAKCSNERCNHTLPFIRSKVINMFASSKTDRYPYKHKHNIGHIYVRMTCVVAVFVRFIQFSFHFSHLRGASVHNNINKKKCKNFYTYTVRIPFGRTSNESDKGKLDEREEKADRCARYHENKHFYITHVRSIYDDSHNQWYNFSFVLLCTARISTNCTTRLHDRSTLYNL